MLEPRDLSPLTPPPLYKGELESSSKVEQGTRNERWTEFLNAVCPLKPSSL